MRLLKNAVLRYETVKRCCAEVLGSYRLYNFVAVERELGSLCHHIFTPAYFPLIPTMLDNAKTKLDSFKQTSVVHNKGDAKKYQKTVFMFIAER